MTTSIIRQVADGVKFYTVIQTGESGMSHSGLAKLAGVSRQALEKLEFTLATKSPSESLKPFVGKAFTLATKDGKMAERSTGNLRVYSAAYCAAVIQHYAIEGNQTAVFSLVKFSAIGIAATGSVSN